MELESEIVWRVVCQGKDAVEQGLRWTVGDDKTIKIYSDPWILDMPLKKEVWTIRSTPKSDDSYVESFIMPSKEWDIRKLRSAFSDGIVGRLSCIPIPNGLTSNILTWHGASIDWFSLKAAYTHCIRR